VSRVGGLEDTVVDADERAATDGTATGFKFAPVTSESLGGALRRAHAAFRDKAAWQKIQHAGMTSDVSWRSRASRYAELYRELVEARTGDRPGHGVN
jgi:starch synthase